MNKKRKYKLVFASAKKYLEEIVSVDPNLNKRILNKHLQLKSKFNNISDVNRRLIESLQNRSMMSNVINFENKKKQNVFKKILCGYSPTRIVKTYKTADELFEKFRSNIPELKDKQFGKRNLWQQFSEGVLNGSKFMTRFDSKAQFDKYVDKFIQDEDIIDALPMLLAMRIKGLGFALACDFLKELGYRDYSKPDTHLIKIFHCLGLSSSTDPYEVYKSIIEMSDAVGEDAYTVDKTFWLIGSGNFYLAKVKTGRNRDRFIKRAKKELKENLQ